MTPDGTLGSAAGTVHLCTEGLTRSTVTSIAGKITIPTWKVRLSYIYDDFVLFNLTPDGTLGSAAGTVHLCTEVLTRSTVTSTVEKTTIPTCKVGAI